MIMPEHTLSLGNILLSKITVSKPRSAHRFAAAHPAGPAPTTTTSGIVSPSNACGSVFSGSIAVFHRYK
jgi:hypothetical protein